MTDGFAYVLEQSTRPQTIGYSLLDSPVGLAAWMLDHDTDSYYKISRAFVDGEPVGNLTRDNILDNITLYWLTGTGASAARWYWEFGRAAAGAAGQAPPPVAVPVGFTNFPGEIFPAPRSWVEVVFPGLAYFNEADKGGHFAAWEEPELFSDGGARGIRSLRYERRSVMSSTVETAIEIRPFHVDIPDEALDDLRRRIAATNWPEKETVADQSQGVPLAIIRSSPAIGRRSTTGAGARRRSSPPAVHHRDRRARHPLHPRPLAARKCVAARSSTTAGRARSSSS